MENNNTDFKSLINLRNKIDGLDLLKTIPENAVKIAFFDPQYRGVLDKLNYGNEGIKQGKRVELNQMPDEVIENFITEINRTLTNTGYLFLWIDKFHLVQGVNEWIKNTDLKTVDLITWHKKTFGLGYRSRRVSEYLLVLQKPPIKAKVSWVKHDIPDVWIEKIEKGIDHPHSKPLGLQTALIEATTKEGDLVLDPASGSFSVFKCCQNLGRNFIGGDLRG